MYPDPEKDVLVIVGTTPLQAKGHKDLDLPFYLKCAKEIPHSWSTLAKEHVCSAVQRGVHGTAGPEHAHCGDASVTWPLNRKSSATQRAGLQHWESMEHGAELNSENGRHVGILVAVFSDDTNPSMNFLFPVETFWSGKEQENRA